MAKTPFRTVWRAISTFATRRPWWVSGAAIALVALVWGVSLYSIASQIGTPFPGFFYGPDRIVSGFTPREFSGLQAGLRPNDRIVEVNGVHWREMNRLVHEADIGTTLTYTVERGDRRLEIPVPTMRFTRDIVLQFVPGYALSSLIFLATGIFVYTRNPSGQLNRYLLMYLLIWAFGMGTVWEVFLSQNKWMTYLLYIYAITAPVAGWIFFWSFPADQTRRDLLARWPLIPGFVILTIGSIVSLLGLTLAAFQLDRPVLWRALRWANGWVYFVIFGLGSLFFKIYPLVRIALRKGTGQLIRQQALVLLLGLCLGLTGWYLFLWTPASLYTAPVANPQWGSVLALLYPLSVGYAILRYQLFDIRIVIRKGLVYSLLTAVLTAVFLLFSSLIGTLYQGLTGQQSLLATLIPALLIAFLFLPVRNRIQSFVDQAFFRRDVQARQTIAAFGQELSTLREHDEVVRLVLDTVTKTLGTREAALWSQVGDEYRTITKREPRSLSTETNLISWLTQEQRALLRRPDECSPHTDELGQLGAVLAVPLLCGGRLLGVLTLNEKRSGDLYTQEDLELLTTLAQNAALALENARLHKERLAILRQQLAQVTMAQEEERRRIAQELHDGVGPAMASLNIRLHTVRKHLEQDGNPVAKELEDLAEHARSNIQDVRRLIYDLRPAVLDELGLVPALRQHVSRYREEHNVQVDLTLGQESKRLSPALETALFRITQEALTNVAKHAQAQRIEIRLTHTPQGIVLHIADDGQGFDPVSAQPGAGIGLWSMRERAEQLGGLLQIDSTPGHGTALTVLVPPED